MIYARGSNPAGFFILPENSQKIPIKIQEKSRQIQFWLGLIFFTINTEKQGGIFDD